MLRYTILDIIINNDDNMSQETFKCFIEAIKENPKIDLMKEINQEVGGIGNIQHRIILRYESEFIPVIKNIIGDFNLTNNIKS
jgi:hypothetical protein